MFDTKPDLFGDESAQPIPTVTPDRPAIEYTPTKKKKTVTLTVSKMGVDGSVTNAADNKRTRSVQERNGLVGESVTMVREDGSRLTLPKDARSLSATLGGMLGVYDAVIKKVPQFGIYLDFSLQGDGLFSGHHAYTLESPDELDGFDQSGIKVLRPLKTADFFKVDIAIGMAIADLTKTFTQLVNKGSGTITDPYTGIVHGISEEDMIGLGLQTDFNPEKEGAFEKMERKNRTSIKQRIDKVWRDFTADNASARGCGSKFATDRDAWADMIAVDPKGKECRKWIPTLDMFKPDLAQITDQQLLPLIPQAEREATMLMLGRALLGREGTPWNIPHSVSPGGQTRYDKQTLKNRCAVLWVGDEAGMGRSTTVEYLRAGFKYLGYTAGAMDDLSRPFGQGSTATKDFAFVEDLSPDKTMEYVTSPIAKSMMSGGSFKVENKGEKAYEVTAQCVLWFNTNRLDLGKVHHLDAGNLARLLPMRNYGRSDRAYSEFQEQYGYPMEVDQGYEALANQYGLGEGGSLVLTLLLLSRSAQKYREFSGRSGRGLQQFVKHLESLRDEFQISVKMTHCQDLIRQYQLLHLGKFNKLPASLDIPTMLDLFTLWSAQGNRLLGVGDHPDQVMDNAKLARSNKRGSVTMAKLFFEALGSESGNSYPQRSDFWIQTYKQQFSQGSVMIEGVDVEQEFQALENRTKLGSDIHPEIYKFWEDTKFLRMA